MKGGIMLAGSLVLLLVGLGPASATNLPTRGFIRQSGLPELIRNGELYGLDQIIVRWREGVSREKIAEFNKRQGVETYSIGKNLRLSAICFSPAVSIPELQEYIELGDIDALLQFLKPAKAEVDRWITIYEESGLVEWATPHRTAVILHHPNDPFYRDDRVYDDGNPDQYGFFRIGASRGWAVTRGSPGVLIGIIDTGVNLDHPDLRANISTTPRGHDYAGGIHGTLLEVLLPWLYEWMEDPNPDIHTGDDGWGTPDPSVGNGEPIMAGFPPDMGVAHGTVCAGIAAAVMDNALGITGLAGHCKILAVRVASAEGTAYIGDVARGIEYAATQGADIISISLGLPSDDPVLKAAVDYAVAQGSAVIAASGNSGDSRMFYPAAYENVLSVGSVNADSQRADFSTYGPTLDVLAPGGEIRTAPDTVIEIIWSTYVFSFADSVAHGMPLGGSGFAGMVGTSMAAPAAAGLAGLIKSIAPTYTPSQIYDAIRAGAYDIPPAGRDDHTGHGMIDPGTTLSYIGIEEERDEDFQLRVEPNPFREKTVISYQLSVIGEDTELITDYRSPITIRIYDLAGRLIRTLPLTDYRSPITEVTWDGTDLYGKPLPTGIYFIRLAGAGGRSVTEKVVVIR